MPTLSDNAICLRQWDFSETSQTVRVLTREHGALRGLAKGSRRDRGLFSGGFEVVTRGQLVAIVKPGRDLSTLTEWRLLEVFPAVRRRLAANRAALLMADLLAHLLNDGDPHPEVYDAAISALRRLETPGDEATALLGFQWTLLTAIGVAPRLDVDVADESPLEIDIAGGPLGFRPAEGGFTEAETGAMTWRVRPATVLTLRELAEAGGSAPPETDAETLRRANRLLAAYARHVAAAELPTLDWAFATGPGDP